MPSTAIGSREARHAAGMWARWACAVLNALLPPHGKGEHICNKGGTDGSRAYVTNSPSSTASGVDRATSLLSTWVKRIVGNQCAFLQYKLHRWEERHCSPQHEGRSVLFRAAKSGMLEILILCESASTLAIERQNLTPTHWHFPQPVSGRNCSWLCRNLG